jgi:hypothetical protein
MTPPDPKPTLSFRRLLLWLSEYVHKGGRILLTDNFPPRRGDDPRFEQRREAAQRTLNRMFRRNFNAPEVDD